MSGAHGGDGPRPRQDDATRPGGKVGAADAIGTYNGANGLAHPTHAATTAAPSMTTHSIGLASATGVAGNIEAPHVTVPKFDAIR